VVSEIIFFFHSPCFLFSLFSLFSLRIPICEQQIIFIGWSESEFNSSKMGKLYPVKKKAHGEPLRISKLSLFKRFSEIKKSLGILSTELEKAVCYFDAKMLAHPYKVILSLCLSVSFFSFLLFFTWCIFLQF
jgi:hypothetical protein